MDHDWEVCRTRKPSSSYLSQSQFRLLEFSHGHTSAKQVEQTIAYTIGGMDDYQVCELHFHTHRVIVYTEKEHVVTAVSTKQNHGYLSERTPDLAADNYYFIAESEAMKQIMGIIQKVSYVDSTVLLLGKSGVGKGAIAKLIHNSSRRQQEKFLTINCGAIPESLIEAELFGYESGSFTGGNKDGKKGLFETANMGTVFLDEIGELPYSLQVKLLEVLQEKQIRRVGGTDNIPINVRIIAATNQDLARLVKNKRFREDLYYRLHVVPIEIPSLVDRKEDILPLIHYFFKRYQAQYKKYMVFHPEALRALEAYHWPGNVRELENMIERLVVTSEDQEIRVRDLPASVTSNLTQDIRLSVGSEIVPLKQAKKMLENELILKAYNLYKSSYKAAEALGVDQSTVAKKLKEIRKNGW